jgi:exonuclease I
MNGDGYVSFKLVQTDKRYMVGLSRASDAGSTTYATIDYAIYINAGDIRVYENSSPKGQYIDMDIRLVDEINIVVIYFISCRSCYRSYRCIKHCSLFKPT